MSTVDIDTEGLLRGLCPVGGGIQSESSAGGEANHKNFLCRTETAPCRSVINSCLTKASASARRRGVYVHYDELGITAREIWLFSSVARDAPCPDSNTSTGEIINGRQLWFSYDHEGRMTHAKARPLNKMAPSTDAGVVITYDAVG